MTDECAQIVVLGATNRAFDIDDAFSRRMPLKIKIPQPSEGERHAILRNLLRKVTHNVSLPLVAALTEGFSGSDLKDLCRRVMVSVANETIYSSQASGLEGVSLRSVNEADFVRAIEAYAKDKKDPSSSWTIPLSSG